MGIQHGVPDSLIACHDAVRVELKEVIDSYTSVLCDMLRYHMGWQDERGHSCSGESGKLSRPTLCLLSCQSVGGDVSQAIPAAAAIELIHNFSLIHDDIEDASDERHHRPTIWKLWGQSQAINAGDAMFTLAYIALLKLKERGVVDEKIAGSIRMLSLACLELCDGQYLDVECENRLDVTVEDYLDMAAKKTAALFGVSTALGAYLGGADSESVDSFRMFGRELGIAYQIYDDIFGIWGTREKIGKSVSDIPQRKKTLPVVYGLQNSEGEKAERLKKFYAQKSIEGEDNTEVTKTLDNVGARNYAENLSQQYYQKALAHLDTTGLDRSRQTPLKEVAHFLLKHDF
jgi:geranylgeranyl diphosphate synthase type I